MWADIMKMDIHNWCRPVVPEHLDNVEALNEFFAYVHNYNMNFDHTVNNWDFYETNLKFSDILRQIFWGIRYRIHAISSITSNSDGIYGRYIWTVSALDLHIKLSCPFLIPLMTHLINFYVSNSVFPIAWRESIIIPVSKIKVSRFQANKYSSHAV